MTPRLLCELPAAGGQVTVNLEQSHYLLKVLRLKLGDQVEVFNGQGLRFQAELVAIQGKRANLLVDRGVRYQALRKHDIWLMQGLPSGDKMDWIIEKAVELGVARLSPLECEHSIVKLSGPRRVKKMAHWQSQIEAACMQSQRDDLMRLDDLNTSQACFEGPVIGKLNFILDPSARLSLLDALMAASGDTQGGEVPRKVAPLTELTVAGSPAATIVMAIGPESGFSDRERAQAERLGFVAVSLGAQVLRTETAALVATAKLQAWLEMFQRPHFGGIL